MSIFADEEIEQAPGQFFRKKVSCVRCHSEQDENEMVRLSLRREERHTVRGDTILICKSCNVEQTNG